MRIAEARKSAVLACFVSLSRIMLVLRVSRFAGEYADFVEREEPEEYASDDVFARKRSPQSRVGGDASIVAEYKKLIRSEGNAHVVRAAEVLECEIGLGKRKPFGIRVVHDGHRSAAQYDGLAGEADNAFDKCSAAVLGEVEYNNVAAPGGSEVVGEPVYDEI